MSSYQDLGFLAWDPLGTLDPPGVPLKEQDTLIDNIRKMVVGAGEVGCGFEAPLEAWYRFLVEPDPYESIKLEQNAAVLVGTDEVLLEQRAAFLRPDSLLAIVMLSDENDCSVVDGGQYFYALQIYTPGTNSPYHLPKPRAACATDPDSPCCTSCGATPPANCDTSSDDCSGALDPLADSINLRCFDQKRRFGIDFLQPIDRYVTGLTSETVSDRHGNVVANPIFGSQGGSGRTPGLVFLAGIVGVPWQDIARKNGSGKPDLLAGLDESGRPAGGFQRSAEMVAGNVWEMLIGNPSKKTPPTDPLMIESVDPRSGTNPVTGDAIQPPGAAVLANPINGHEFSVPQRNDLQYACIFPLEQPRDCTDPDQVACDCPEAGNDNPLCQDPNSGKAGQTQYFAKAYPGTRQLRVLKEIGPQGIVGSICPEQQTDPGKFNYGYRPSIGGVLDHLEQSLSTRFCLSQELSAESNKRLDCRLIEARHAEVGTCDCNTPARKTLTDADLLLLAEIKSDPLHTSEQWNCFCELIQTEGNNLQHCQEDVAEPVINEFGNLVNGWCYIDGSGNHEVGNPELLNSCLGGQQRVIRFVGDGPLTGARLFLSCNGT